MSRKFVDLTGQKFGHWLVVASRGRDRSRHDLWLSRCDCCGEERVVRGDTLRRGKSTRCFECTQRPALRGTPRLLHTRHGLSKSRPYHIWAGMLDRCFNENRSNYCYYGGREDNPVTVDEYYSDFSNWYADIGYQLHDNHLSQDRIDNDRGYEPGNLRAADASTQIANQRRRPINLIDLKERIAIGGYIRRRERDFILECINAHAPPDDAAGGFAPPPF